MRRPMWCSSEDPVATAMSFNIFNHETGKDDTFGQMARALPVLFIIS